MPKNASKKFGNALDKKSKGPETPSLLASQEEYQAFLDERRAIQDNMMLLLMEYYKIPPNTLNSWATLARRLAYDFVPAMRFEEKRGQPKKWDWMKEAALYGLVYIEQKKRPEVPTKEIFADIPRLAQNTILASIIPADANYRNLENIIIQLVPKRSSYERDNLASSIQLSPFDHQ